MTSEKQILRDVTARFEVGVGGQIDQRLNRSGRSAFNQAFRLTIGRFAKRAAKAKLDVWQIKRFHDFILFAAERIGRAAKAAANGGVVDREAFQTAAVGTMLHIKKKTPCRLRREGNKLVDVPRVPKAKKGEKPGIFVQSQGEVCTGYLVDQMRG